MILSSLLCVSIAADRIGGPYPTERCGDFECAVIKMDVCQLLVMACDDNLLKCTISGDVLEVIVNSVVHKVDLKSCRYVGGYG